MMFGQRKIRNDPKICRMVNEIVGGPEGARAAMENMIGKDLTQQLINGNRSKRSRKTRP